MTSVRLFKKRKAMLDSDSLMKLIMIPIFLLIVALVFANILPNVVSPVFNTSANATSLYNAFKDIWAFALTPFIGSSSADTIAPYVAGASLLAIAGLLTWGIVDYIKEKIKW